MAEAVPANEVIAALRAGAFDRLLDPSGYQPLAPLEGADLSRIVVSPEFSMAWAEKQDAVGRPGDGVNLSGVVLKMGTCVKAHLNGASFSEARITGTDFSRAQMAFASFNNSTITDGAWERTVLYGASFHKANLAGLMMWGTNLEKARFENAVLENVSLRKTNCRQSTFRNSRLTKCTFTGSTLEFADLHGSAFDECVFSGVSLIGANLTGAMFRDDRGMRLDGNDISSTRFHPSTTEAWHTVRRAYTGTKFFFHLLLLAAFLAGYAVRVAMWTGVNRAQTAIIHASERLDDAAHAAASDHPDAASVLSEAAAELGKVTESLTADSRKYRVWEVLLGLDRGWGTAFLAALLLTYNIGRAWLTYSVGAMREDEERSGFAPYWKDYKSAWYAHICLMRWLMLAAIGSFLWHAWGWLSSPVWLPSPGTA